jgi:hypothetical protein
MHNMTEVQSYSMKYESNGRHLLKNWTESDLHNSRSAAETGPAAMCSYPDSSNPVTKGRSRVHVPLKIT